MNSNLEKAKQGEDLAADFLVRAGYTILARNYRIGHGELDIIAMDGEYLVFVEVKTRTSEHYGHPAYSITRGKQRQLISLAEKYMYENGHNDMPCRMDVVTVEFEAGKPVINHIQNAFTYIP